MYNHDESEPAPIGICDCCGQPATLARVDIGIGPYEFWGQRGFHSDVRTLTPCCESTLTPGGCREVENDVHVARRDHKDGKVKAGQRYRRIVRKLWRDGGPMWFVTEKQILTK